MQEGLVKNLDLVAKKHWCVCFFFSNLINWSNVSFVVTVSIGLPSKYRCPLIAVSSVISDAPFDIGWLGLMYLLNSRLLQIADIWWKSDSLDSPPVSKSKVKYETPPLICKETSTIQGISVISGLSFLCPVLLTYISPSGDAWWCPLVANL